MSSQLVSPALTREHWPDVQGLVLCVFTIENPVSHLRRVPVHSEGMRILTWHFPTDTCSTP